MRSRARKKRDTKLRDALHKIEQNKKDSTTKESPAGEDRERRGRKTTALGYIPSVPTEASRSQRMPADDDQRKAEEQYRNKQLFWQRTTAISTFLAVIAAVVYAWVTYKQWNEAHIANDHLAKQFEASERPYVSFGNRDGEVVRLAEINDTPSLALYFYNSGETPARRFLVNAYSNARIPISRNDHHLARFIESDPTDPTFSGVATVTGEGDIPAESTFIRYLGNDYTPDAAQWQQLRKGQTILMGNPGALHPYPFEVFGTFEYCDIFGRYHCDAFAADYNHLLALAEICGNPR
jgi:hypothetical protein